SNATGRISTRRPSSVSSRTTPPASAASAGSARPEVSADEPHRVETAAPVRRSWADLGPRLASAAVLIVVTLVTLYLGGYVFAALVGAVFAGCYREWERMVTLKPLSTSGAVLIGLLALSALAYPFGGPLLTLALVAVACGVALFAEQPVGLWRAGGVAYFGVVGVAILG